MVYKLSNLHYDIKLDGDLAMLDTHFSSQAVSVMTAVNSGEMKISRNPAETLVAFSIGSGIGVSVYDPLIKAGGVLNFVLPDASTMPVAKAQRHPFMFADIGLAAFLNALLDIGVQIENLKVVLAGGAQIMDQTAQFNIGHQNHRAVMSFLKDHNMAIHYEDIGGLSIRTLRLDLNNGDNIIQIQGQTEVNV